jgi:rare lipoprotein A
MHGEIVTRAATPFAAHEYRERFASVDPLNPAQDNGKALQPRTRVNINFFQPGSPDSPPLARWGKEQDGYDGIQPQSGRSFCALQSLGGQYRRNNGKRNSRPRELFERRGRAGSPSAFLESPARGGEQACQLRGISGKKSASFLSHRSLHLAAFLFAAFLTACGHKHNQQVQTPPPPPIAEQQPTPQTATRGTEPSEKIEVPANAKPIFEETGIASWYGAPYHNRRGSNGEVYDMNAMTAAHLTLPLGSIVRVTNVKTGHSAIVRITDRGPFVEGRILDLSLAAAKAVDVYLPGTAMVKVEVLKAPAALDIGGRWAVQIGGFTNEKTAAGLAEHLQRRYQTAKVLKFASPTGDWWVRVRVLDDDRHRAQEVAHETQTADASIFVVRLD